jgi:hypothetical protein
MERQDVKAMSDREILEELLVFARNMEDVLKSFAQHPMAKMMMPANGKR